MPGITRCPNASCGRVSQLVDDPLGRIFRCPRCSTKLPTAPAAAADAGWTAISRTSPRAGGGSSGFEGGLGRVRTRSVARGQAARVAIGTEIMPYQGESWGTGAVGAGGRRLGGARIPGRLRERRHLRRWPGLGNARGRSERPRVEPVVRAGGERRGLYRAAVASRRAGVGLERGVAVGIAGDRGGLGDGLDLARGDRLGRGRGRATWSVPHHGRAGPGAARNGVSRVGSDARARGGAEGAAAGRAAERAVARAVSGRGAGSGQAASPADRPGV